MFSSGVPFRGLRDLFASGNLRLLPLLGKLGFTSTMQMR